MMIPVTWRSLQETHAAWATLTNQSKQDCFSGDGDWQIAHERWCRPLLQGRCVLGLAQIDYADFPPTVLPSKSEQINGNMWDKGMCKKDSLNKAVLEDTCTIHGVPCPVKGMRQTVWTSCAGGQHGHWTTHGVPLIPWDKWKIWTAWTSVGWMGIPRTSHSTPWDP